MVVDYKKILQLDAAGVTGRGIADVLSCSRNTVASVLRTAEVRGVVYDDIAGMEPAAVRELFTAETKHVSDRVAPDLAEVHKEMARPNVTLQLLWSVLSALLSCAVEGRCASGRAVPLACP